MDYAAHDSVYRLRKTEEAEGWFVSEKEYETKFRPPIEEVLSSGRFPLSGALLELGCGAGNFSVWLAQKGYTVSGIDISPTAISWAKERAAEQGVAVNFLLGNVLDLAEYDAGEFDIVLDGYCLHCIIGEDRSRCLSNTHRVLKPGGWLLVFTGCPNAKTEEIKGYDPCTCIASGDHLPAPRYLAPPEMIVQELVDAGFTVRTWKVDTDGDLLAVVVQKSA